MTATARSTSLVRVTPDAQAAMGRWIDRLKPGSTTNFKGAFNEALAQFTKGAFDDASSGCTRPGRESHLDAPYCILYGESLLK